MEDEAAAEGEPTGIQAEARRKIEGRRRIVLERIEDGSAIRVDGDWKDLADAEVAEQFATRDLRTGLALSGGGIRSATISLGLVEALAARGRFYGLDMMSTVSGGGYCGSFLRSLYVEREPGVGKAENDAVLTDRFAFADATLLSFPDQQYFRGERGQSAFVRHGKVVKNPLWWLRENGRYLAPGGMSAYGYALAYIVRNWVTLLLFVLACMMVAFAAVQMLLVAIAGLSSNIDPAWTADVFRRLEDWRLYTPLMPILALVALAGTGLAGAYWLSLPLPFGRPGHAEAPGRRAGGVIAAILLLLALLITLLWLHGQGLLPADATAKAWTFGLVIGLSAMLFSAFLIWSGPAASRVDFRREQTKWLARYSLLFLILCGIAAIDWAALALRLAMDNDEALLSATVGSGALASVIAFLIAKVPEWVGGEDSGIRKLLRSHADQAALVAAIAILAAIALLADLLVIKLLWDGRAWVGGELDFMVSGAVIGLIALFAVLFGRSVNFANLLSLTPFYGSRLTRAYLGASNAHRLDIDNQGDVTHGIVGDDISLRTYMEADSPAPLHLINVTRNRTVGDRITKPFIDVDNDDPLVREDRDDPRGRLASYESSLTLHDRHGDRMVFGPFGVRVGAEFFGWNDVTDPPSLGMLCAISGAAVGSGMGRLTSLGKAMALTLANVRLGYWWKAQKRGAGDTSSGGGSLPGLACLFSELLGRFGTKDHWQLSDGGHSENSGALSLLERGCGLILVADNAQDPTFAFADLEIFIRTARTDIGMEVSIATPAKFPKSLQAVKACFFNGTPGDWRERVKKQDNEAFALLLKASDIPHRVNGVWKRRHAGSSWIIWLKPNRFADLPADIATYAELQPDFPQQSTANQFFGEAQWESYRRLGFEMGRRLFRKPEVLADFLPVIYRKPA